jgi:hypothetical protein
MSISPSEKVLVSIEDGIRHTADQQSCGQHMGPRESAGFGGGR